MGTSIFIIKDSVQYEERKDLQLDLHSDLTNSCFIELDKHTINNRRNIVLGCIYKPPHVSIAKFNEKCNDICFSLSNTNKDVYVLGDFNINLSDSCSNNHHTQEFKNILFSNSFVPLIHKPTRINNNSASIIDSIFTNVSIEKIVAAGILATKAYSYHFPIFAILKNISREKRDKTIVNKIFSQKHIAKFNKYLKHVDWNHVYSSNVISESYTHFHNIVNTGFNTFFPEIISTVTYKIDIPG